MINFTLYACTKEVIEKSPCAPPTEGVVRFKTATAQHNGETYSISEELKKLNDDSEQEVKKRPFLLCGDNVYMPGPRINELGKSAKMLVFFPLHTLIRKILIPIFVYLPLKGLTELLGSRCEWLQNYVKRLEEDHGCKWAWTVKQKVEIGLFEFSIPLPVPLRAIVGMVAHLIIGVLALNPVFTNYFNKLNGDVERWVNGHTDEDVEKKSAAKRGKEMPYLALCQQPLFKINKKLSITEDNENFIYVTDLPETVQRVAFRALITGSFEAHMQVEIAGRCRCPVPVKATVDEQDINFEVPYPVRKSKEVVKIVE